MFGISLATIKRYLKQRRETGQLAVKPIPGRPPKKRTALEATLAAQLAAHDDATERDETARAAWRDLTGYLPVRDLIFVDECGRNIAFTPLYARAPRGKRTYGAPRNRSKNTMLLAGLTLSGIRAPMMLEGAVDTRAFEAYVEQVFAPSLRSGQIEVLDNLSVHIGEHMRQAIEARGCQLLFLPA